MIKTKTEFNKAIFDLCKQLTEDGLEYYKRFDHIKGIVFKTDGGRKYIKVKGFETTEHGTSNGRIHCFVESTTGDIYKPANWKAPHLKGDAIRGNIFDKSTFEKTDPHGGWLYHGRMKS